MPEYTPLVETLRIDAMELSKVQDVIAFMESRVAEAMMRLRVNNGLQSDKGLIYEVGAWRRIGPNFECDVTLCLSKVDVAEGVS